MQETWEGAILPGAFYWVLGRFFFLFVWAVTCGGGLCVCGLCSLVPSLSRVYGYRVTSLEAGGESFFSNPVSVQFSSLLSLHFRRRVFRHPGKWCFSMEWPGGGTDMPCCPTHPISDLYSITRIPTEQICMHILFPSVMHARRERFLLLYTPPTLFYLSFFSLLGILTD